MKVQAGDVVHVRGRVKRIGVCGLPVIDINEGAIDATKGELHLHTSGIVHVEPRALQVGDKVICPSMSRATVAAIGEGFTWVKYEDGSGYSTCDTSALERI